VGSKLKAVLSRTIVFILLFSAFFTLIPQRLMPLVQAQGRPLISPPSASDSSFDWPTFHQNFRRTGYSPSDAPTTNNTAWVVNFIKELSNETPELSFADGKLFASSADDVYALNGEDGNIIWKYTRNQGDGSSATIYDGDIYVSNGFRELLCLDEMTGGLKWSFPTRWVIESSPAILDDKLIFGEGDYYVYALLRKTGELLWSFKTEDRVYSSPAIDDNMIFITDVDNLYCLNADDGTLIWQMNVKTAFSSPTISDNKVIIASLDGYIYALNKNDGAVIWSYETGYSIRGSTPAIANGKVFIGLEFNIANGYSLDDGLICALDEENGRLLWKYKTGAIKSSPAVAYGMVFVTSKDGYLYALNESEGMLVWKYATILSSTLENEHQGDISSPIVADRKVFVAATDGTPYGTAEINAIGVITNRPSPPSWLKVGTYASYRGTFTGDDVWLEWRVISLQENIAQIGISINLPSQELRIEKIMKTDFQLLTREGISDIFFNRGALAPLIINPTLHPQERIVDYDNFIYSSEGEASILFDSISIPSTVLSITSDSYEFYGNKRKVESWYDKTTGILLKEKEDQEFEFLIYETNIGLGSTTQEPTPSPLESSSQVEIKGIKLIPQETDSSCWAASSLMILDFYGIYEPLPSQLEFASKLGSEEYYWNGLPSYKLKSWDWALSDPAFTKLDADPDYGIITESLTFHKVKLDIDLDRPIIILYAGDLWIWELQILGPIVPFHSAVIVGYIDEPGEESDKVIIHDPWPRDEGTIEIREWENVKEELWFVCNALRTKPQVLEGTVLTLQETQHKLYLHAYDSLGRHVGLNYETNQTEIGIPGAYYMDFDDVIMIVLPLDVTNFQYVVDAKYAREPTESYNIKITKVKGEKITFNTVRSGTINQDEKHESDFMNLSESVEDAWWQIPIAGVPMYLVLIGIVVVVIVIAFVLIFKRRRKR